MGYVDKNTQKVIPRTYFMYYVGDYDSAAWLYSMFYDIWNEPNRGSIPLGWAINPNHKERFPVVFDMIYNSLSKNDRIITGDSGAGYINPTQLFFPRWFSGLPPADQLWIDYSTPYYKQFDISFTGFVINGAAGNLTNEAENLYTSFSPDGMVEEENYQPAGKDPVHLAGKMPVFQEVDLQDDIDESVKIILDRYNPGVQFQVFRTILKTPTYHQQIYELVKKSGKDIVVVDPLVLSKLTQIYLNEKKKKKGE